MLAIFTRRPIPIPKYMGLTFSLLGVILISLGAGKSDVSGISVLGILLAFFSAVMWATYWMINNKNKDIDGTVSLFMGFLFGTIYLLVAALFVGINIENTTSLLAGMYVGAFEIAIPFICFGMAIRMTSNPALVNQLCYLSPFMPIKFFPIKFDKLRLKLEAAKRAGYDKGITFEFSHFMSPQSAYAQAGHLYDRYKEYFGIK